MIINRNNYKTYFLDFWEANLEEKDKTALLLFLEKIRIYRMNFWILKQRLTLLFQELLI